MSNPLRWLNTFLTFTLIALVIGVLALLFQLPNDSPALIPQPPTATTRPTLAPMILEAGPEIPSSLPTEIAPSITPPAGADTVIFTGTPPSPSRILIAEETTPKGLVLVITAADSDLHQRLGPIARGAYAVGPNDDFLVYVTNYGQVLALKMGDTTFFRIVNLRKNLAATVRGMEPDFGLSFYDNGFAFTLIIRERVFGQTVTVTLPRAITHEGHR